MIPSPNFDDAKSTDPRLTKLADVAAQLGFEIVDIAGFLDRIDEQSTAQLRSLTEVRQSTVAMSNANNDVREALHSVVVATDDTLAKVNGSVTYVREAGQRSQTVAQWVKQLSERMQEVAKSLAAVEANNAEIAGIARQVNILAINAKIEAARAGDSGRGFGVVAEAINALSQKTAKAAEGIADNIETLSGWVGTLRDESATVSTDANEVITGSVETDHALNSIAEGVRKTHSEANRVTAAAESVKRALDAFRPAFEDIGGSVESTAAGIHQARERTNALVDASETIVQNTVSLGGASADDRFIERVRRDAAKISKLFEQALLDGKITKANLMDRNYQPIPGSNPVQVLTGNTKLCDTLLPAILEEALQLDPRVVFCAAVDVNGYLPTHNKKFSQMQGSDVQWNTANCRNRRIFDDRVGLKAGRNKEKFLVQVYRRDMGGGKFTMMKDVSAPIIVNGQLWGGLRLAYTL